jgi:hypothetical protein
VLMTRKVSLGLSAYGAAPRKVMDCLVSAVARDAVRQQNALLDLMTKGSVIT